MAVRIKFDASHNPIQPTIVLATRQGRKLGKIPASNVVFKDSMANGHEMTFKVNQADCNELWDRITDFKLVWVRDWDRWFEIDVETDDTGSLEKNVSAKSLGVAELSQINLYNREINTDDDIARDDYVPTVFYNPEDPEASLLHRMLDKAPHYRIGHVDTSLMNIQRTFTFDNKSIYDAMQEVAEEIDCIITADCITDPTGGILRQINAYDLKSYCLECGTRGDFIDECSNCGSTNLSRGYGKDTSIFVSTENLADNIKYSTDNGSVKNCFRLEAGDDLMTAAIVSCNPNGSGYIWHISDSMKEDMSDALIQKLDDYDALYAYYQKEHSTSIPDALLNAYNALIEKYRAYTDEYKTVTKNIVGYPALMERYFDTIDFELYLRSKLMPDVSMEDTTASQQITRISEDLRSGVSVKNLSTCSISTAESAVLGFVKAVADSRYEITVSESTYVDGTWGGIVKAVNVSNEEDAAVSAQLTCRVNDDYAGYVKQKILKSIKKSTDDASGVDTMFKLDDNAFRNEMRKYCLSRLSAFRDIAQSCVDILIEHGIADKSKFESLNEDLYNEIYLPYYNKLRIVEAEIKVREQEIATVSGAYDADGKLISAGMKAFLQAEKDAIQMKLSFDDYLGEDCLLEFSAYRREDTYRNNNYISDGLNNAELFQMAERFIEVARSEIIKSATLQHKITAKLKNFLGMKEFAIIVDYFEIGNWIRVKTDGKLCKLRMIEYEINFENFDDINVDFSDVVSAGNTVSDIESILSSASSMATSYESVARQAKQGQKSNAKLADWVDRGLELTKMRIIDSADNQNVSWDSHGLLCKEYLPIMGTYDEKQLKIINRGLYLTDDDWRTSKAGIGDFTYWNPKTGKMEESYGVIADTIVGNIILSKEVGIYNMDNSITMDKNGLTITSFDDGETTPVVFNVRKRTIDADGVEHFSDELYLDADGNLVINGSVRIFSENNPGPMGTLNSINDEVNAVKDRIDGFNGLHFYIRYSPYEDGREMTDAPNANTVYIGTCNTDEKKAPTLPERYVWTKIKGETGIQGIPGIPGADGTSRYLHIKYSNDGETFTGNSGEDLGDWIGTCVTESSSAPTSFAAYTWSRFNGVDGINTASISLYKRYEIAPTGNNGITSDLTYTFANSTLSGNLNGWSMTFPPSNGKPCYVIQAVAASQGASDVIKANEWSAPIKFVEDGVPGNDGYNTATVYLYKRSDATSVTVDWTTELTYSFTLSKLTSVPAGWSASIPDGDLPLFVTAATAASTTKTDKVAYTEWSAPVMLSKNGADGGKGADGINGTNGLNSATIFLYKRSATKPGKPTADTTYTFKTGVLTGITGWTQSVPSGTDPCYVIHATAISNAESDQIKGTEWSDPVILAQNGADGNDGNDGANGHNTALVYLYKRSASAATVDWSNALTYSFSSKALASVPAGWSQTIPSGTNPLYVTMANAYSDTDSDTIAANEWCTPVILAQNGSKGTTYYTWIKYADTPTTGMSDNPDGKTYIGIAYNKTSKTESTTYSDYSWSLIKGADGVDGVNGEDGTTYYTWIRYADDANGSGMSSDPTGKEYIGMAYNKTTSSPSNNAADYTWSLFKGSDGVDGKDGANGVSSYFHIRYSEQASGSNMTAIPTDTTVYIGVCSTTSPTAPTDTSKYKWSKFRGNDGIPGAPGANGKTQYLHIKYSNDGETFTGNSGEDLGDWIGTKVDFEQADSTVFTDYTWRKFAEDVDDELAYLQEQITINNGAISSTVQQTAENLRDSIENVESTINGRIDNVTDTINDNINHQINAVSSDIEKRYAALMKEVENQLTAHKADIGQYMTFDNDGLTLGASSSNFKTVIDNTGMYFKQGAVTVSYVSNNQLHIPNAVIESTLMLGNFFWTPRRDGSMSLVWQQ